MDGAPKNGRAKTAASSKAAEMDAALTSCSPKISSLTSDEHPAMGFDECIMQVFPYFQFDERTLFGLTKMIYRKNGRRKGELNGNERCTCCKDGGARNHKE
jgi:hypothetical protein